MVEEDVPLKVKDGKHLGREGRRCREKGKKIVAVKKEARPG